MKSRGKKDVIYPIRDICSSLKLQVADVENTKSLFTLTSSNCTASDTYFENCFNLLCNIDGSNYGIILFTRRGNRNGKSARTHQRLCNGSKHIFSSQFMLNIFFRRVILSPLMCFYSVLFARRIKMECFLIYG